MSWAHINRHVEKKCKLCGTPFVTSIPKQVFDSFQCKQRWHKRKDHKIFTDENYYSEVPEFKNAIPRTTHSRGGGRPKKKNRDDS